MLQLSDILDIPGTPHVMLCLSGRPISYILNILYLSGLLCLVYSHRWKHNKMFLMILWLGSEFTIKEKKDF